MAYSRIPYGSLPQEIKNHLARTGKTADEWERKLSADAQHKIVRDFSVAATAAYVSATKPGQAAEIGNTVTTLLLHPGLGRILAEYMGGDLEIKNYSEKAILQYGIFGKTSAKLVFLSRVVRGQQEEAHAMAEKSTPEGLLPALLLEPGRVTDHTETLDRSVQRTSDVTAYRFALMAMHVRFHPDEICMAEMIVQHLRRLPNGEAERQKQYADQFPKGWEVAERERAAADSLALRTLFKVISAVPKNATYEDCKKECALAEEAFRKHLDDQLTEVVNGDTRARAFKTGFHFNAWPLNEEAKDEEKVYGLLGESLQLYANNFDNFGGQWNSSKNRLFAKIIDEHILNFVPAKLAQVICMGFYRYMYEKQKLSQSFEFHYAPGYCIYRSLASSTLKYDPGGPRQWVGALGRPFQNLCQTTSASLQNHAARPKT